MGEDGVAKYVDFMSRYAENVTVFLKPILPGATSTCKFFMIPQITIAFIIILPFLYEPILPSY